jgi:hypothetical protein
MLLTFYSQAPLFFWQPQFQRSVAKKTSNTLTKTEVLGTVVPTCNPSFPEAGVRGLPELRSLKPPWKHSKTLSQRKQNNNNYLDSHFPEKDRLESWRQNVFLAPSLIKCGML